MAGSDCGFATFASMLTVDPGITWAKLAAMAEGHDVLTVEGLGSWLDDGVAEATTLLANPPLQVGREQVGANAPSGAGQWALDPIQEAFLARTGFQCSYCTPGILLTAKALLAEQPDASDEEIREYLAGNLCRCGSYVKILDSMHEAIARLRDR